MKKQRLDVAMVQKGLVASRSQAESYIKLGQVQVNGQAATKAGQPVGEQDVIVLTAEEQYVSRAALKLASVAQKIGVDFAGKVVLDIGSSTGGFTQYALQHGAERVFAVDVGTNQLHPTLRNDPRIDLMEQTDFRTIKELSQVPQVVLADVSFISLREILPNAHKLGDKNTLYAIMVKPQFEAGEQYKHKGVIKNDAMRRQILKDFEAWVQKLFVIKDKADSEVAGAHGNQERFYLLKKAG